MGDHLLSSGVLVKFLQEIDVDGSTLRDQKPVLLQIRSIIPVLREGDLWPNQGFFLKVSDLSHALYVSLPQEQDDMVLCNKLHLGQFIFVDKLEAAYPVPMLKGVTPLTGRHPCYGNPKDLLPMHNLEKFLGVSNLEAMVSTEDHAADKKIIERSQSLNMSEQEVVAKSSDQIDDKDVDDIHTMKIKKQPTEKSRSFGASKVSKSSSLNNSYKPPKISMENKISCSKPRRNNNVEGNNYKGSRKYKSSSTDEDYSDVESAISVSSRATSKLSKLPSWKGRYGGRTSEVSDTQVGKPEVIKPMCSSAATFISPGHNSRNGNSNNNSSSKIRRTLTSIPTLSTKNYSRSASASERIKEDLIDDEVTLTSSMNDHNNFTDTNIAWDFLPTNLVKLGREVLRQRDMALLVTVEALQEASTSERLLKCLSTYSELFSTKDNQHPPVDKFFSLEKDLVQTKLIFQALKGDSPPPRKTDTNYPSNVHSMKQTLKTAALRKQNATSWVKAALVSDLNPDFDSIKVREIFTEASNSNHEGLSTTTHDTDTTKKGTFVAKKQRSNSESNVGFEIDHVDEQPSWVKGSNLVTSAELENALENECTTWFLTYIEDYLDWVSSKTTASESDVQVAEMMFQIKRVNDWLEKKCKHVSNLEESELESCGRVRNKIYGILLKHAERTALNAMVASP